VNPSARALAAPTFGLLGRLPFGLEPERLGFGPLDRRSKGGAGLFFSILLENFELQLGIGEIDLGLLQARRSAIARSSPTVFF
jgi:hypothetical protein